MPWACTTHTQMGWPQPETLGVSCPGGWESNIKVSQGWFPLRPLWLVCRRPSPCCDLICFLYVYLHPDLLLSFFFLKRFIYLAVLCLGCRSLSLHCCMGHLSSQHVGSSFWFSCPAACGSLVPRPGIKPTCPALEGGFLTTGPSGKSHDLLFFFFFEVLKTFILYTKSIISA